MGKIIRNGVEYSGAVEAATAVNYDGSVSGLKAQTVQEAIDELSAGTGGKFEYDLLASCNTSTETDYIVDLNKYTFLLFTITQFANDKKYIRVSQIIPVSLFKQLAMVSTSWAAQNEDCNCSYVDDNTVRMIKIGTTNYYTGELYGIKSTGGSGNNSGESLEWNKLSDNGNNAIALPTDWKEFVISITHGGSTISNHYVNGISFGDFIRFGFYGSSTDVLRAWFSLQNNTITIGELNYNGNTVQKTDFTYEVLYR